MIAIRRLLAIPCVFIGSWTAQASDPEPVDFNRQVRPILSNTCYKCHGPDEEQRESGLRLDIRELAP